jgi:hypothetical protein
LLITGSRKGQENGLRQEGPFGKETGRVSYPTNREGQQHIDRQMPHHSRRLLPAPSISRIASFFKKPKTPKAEIVSAPRWD